MVNCDVPSELVVNDVHDVLERLSVWAVSFVVVELVHVLVNHFMQHDVYEVLLVPVKAFGYAYAVPQYVAILVNGVVVLSWYGDAAMQGKLWLRE